MIHVLRLPAGRTISAYLLLCVLAATMPCGGSLRAQELDSKGKEFWVSFMSNLGSGLGSETSTLRLYLSCDRPTTATITYTATGQTEVIGMPVANKPVEVRLDELYGRFTELEDVFGFAETSYKSYHITAEDEITLYGINIRSKSSDAFLGLPTDVLTGRYIVLAYPNGWDGNGFYDTPSQFCLIATEDSTAVKITPPLGTRVNTHPGAQAFTVNLMKGQVFFGQASLAGEQDVSGTEILADKPVAVFSGHKRTSIPTRVGNFRDHLVEQLPPLDAWGRGALVTPHYVVTPESRDTAVVRILAAFPGTGVTITNSAGSSDVMLGPGISIELPLLEAMSVFATQPILVAQYEHSVNNQVFDIGDPFMMLIPPAEQFDTAYAFQSIIHEEFTNYHFINVVIPAGAEGSLRLDSQPLNVNFLPIPGSRYVYAQKRVIGGSHFIRADSAFGLYVYGYGHANSYGYPGGMLFRKLVSDFQPPEITWDQDCGIVRGMAFDDKITDTGIDSIYTTSETSNMDVTVDPFASGQDSVGYTAHLIDPYQDGVLGIQVIDRGGRSRTQNNVIPGFTLRIAGQQDAPALMDTLVATNSDNFCRQISIRNYGRFEQEITGAVLAQTFPGASITTNFPVKIAAGGLGTIEICFQNLPDTVFSVTLDINGPCVDRRVAIVPIDNRIDTTAPSVTMDGRPCGDEFILSYFESFRASGIISVDVDTLINCSVETLTDTSNLPASVLQLKLHRGDARYDMIYAIVLRDAAGNSVIDRDTIGGFTVAAVATNDYSDTLGLRYDRDWHGDSILMNRQNCDSVALTNYGLRPLDINRIVMKGNVDYSIPPAQFPLRLNPGETRRVALCIEGVEAGLLLDTMMIFDGCDHLEELKVVTPIRVVNGLGQDICNNSIGITTYAPTKRGFLTPPMPNPAAGTAAVDVALAHPARVDLEIFDASGNPAVPVLRGIELPAGINRVSFDVSKLDNGAYFCRMRTASGEVFVEKLMVTR